MLTFNQELPWLDIIQDLYEADITVSTRKSTLCGKCMAYYHGYLEILSADFIWHIRVSDTVAIGYPVGEKRL